MSFSHSMHYELMVRAAYYYYCKEYTQTKIAEMLGISRLTLGRILKEAKDTGVVKIEIVDHRNLTSCLDLESRLCDRYHIQNAVVTTSLGTSQDEVSRSIALAAGQYLARTLRSGMRVSLTWGKTISLMVDSLAQDKTIKDLSVSTMIGGASTAETYVQPGMLAGNLLRKYDGRGYVINAPFICQTEEISRKIREEPGVKDVIARCAASDLAIIGIGEKPDFNASYWASDQYSREDLSRIIASGAVGDICGCYIDREGKPCCPDVNRRIVAIDPADLKNYKFVMAVAGGERKTDGVRAALLGGYVDFLVTDSRTAEAIL